jgi:hypothetical protein
MEGGLEAILLLGKHFVTGKHRSLCNIKGATASRRFAKCRTIVYLIRSTPSFCCPSSGRRQMRES